MAMRASALVFAALLLATGTAHAGEVIVGCLVDDPTSTPLNVRNQPGGKILFTLPNGTFVMTQSSTEKWTKIFIPITGRHKNQEGWVFTAFLYCSPQTEEKILK